MSAILLSGWRWWDVSQGLPIGQVSKAPFRAIAIYFPPGPPGSTAGIPVTTWMGENHLEGLGTRISRDALSPVQE